MKRSSPQSDHSKFNPPKKQFEANDQNLTDAPESTNSVKNSSQNELNSEQIENSSIQQDRCEGLVINCEENSFGFVKLDESVDKCVSNQDKINSEKNNNKNHSSDNNNAHEIKDKDGLASNFELSAKSIVTQLEEWRKAFMKVTCTESEALQQLEVVKEQALQVKQQKEEELCKMKAKAKQLATCLKN